MISHCLHCCVRNFYPRQMKRLQLRAVFGHCLHCRGKQGSCFAQSSSPKTDLAKHELGSAEEGGLEAGGAVNPSDNAVEQVAAIAGRARWTFSCKVEVPLPVQKHGVLELRAVVDELLEVVAVDSCAAR